MARYAVMTAAGHWLGHGFPWGTLAVNLAGSFLMGALIEVMALAWSPGPEMRALLVVGVLGGFTTFSTFSLDVATLLERQNLAGAFAYVSGSLILGVAALFAGLGVMRLALR